MSLTPEEAQGLIDAYQASQASNPDATLYVTLTAETLQAMAASGNDVRGYLGADETGKLTVIFEDAPVEVEEVAEPAKMSAVWPPVVKKGVIYPSAVWPPIVKKPKD